MLDAQVLPERYGDVQLIARGAMGDVFLAEDRELGRPVAIKLLGERFLGDDDIRRRFTREGLASARLSGHPHIVTIYDVGEWRGRPFIVMEYLAGGTVADRSRGGIVAPSVALDWLAQAGEALDAAHREGIVHRDVKPQNLVFDARGQLHVADFGIARVLDETGEMTVGGTVLGTAGYLAPEQARGEPATPASDIYALGVVAYELLTGVRPFRRESQAAEAAAHVTDPVPHPSQRGLNLPATLDHVFDRVLAKDPSRRYATAHEFVDRLALALRQGTRGTRAADPPPRILVRRRRPRALVLALAVLALALAGGAGVAAAMLVGGGDGGGGAEASHTVVRVRTVTSEGTTSVRTVTTTVPAATTPSGPPASTATSAPAGGHSLNDRGYLLMRQGAYASALPLLEDAVAQLTGLGPSDPYEAYANYNLGYTLLQLGRCQEALTPLERADQLEDRPEVPAAIRRARACA
jgi:eukaryotic-like serine/threonine-protein kinase